MLMIINLKDTDTNKGIAKVHLMYITPKNLRDPTGDDHLFN